MTWHSDCPYCGRESSCLVVDDGDGKQVPHTCQIGCKHFFGVVDKETGDFVFEEEEQK